MKKRCLVKLTPTGRARWSLQLRADEWVALHIVESISHESVRQVLKNAIKPWQKRMVYCA